MKQTYNRHVCLAQSIILRDVKIMIPLDARVFLSSTVSQYGYHDVVNEVAEMDGDNFS